MGKAKPRWGATVPLPRARPVAEQIPPRLVIVGASGAQVVDDAEAFPVVDLRPARTFRSRLGHRHAPQRPYVEAAGGHIMVESRAESVAAHLLSRRPEVSRVYPQPFWMERAVEGRPSWACPDFLAERTDGTLLVVEVKGTARGLQPRTLSNIAAVRTSCRRLGLGFELMTGLDDHEQAIFDLLHAFSGSRVPVGPGWQKIRRDVRDSASRPVPLEDLWQLGPAWQTKPLIWWMLWHNELCFDWSKPLDEHTAVVDHSLHDRADPLSEEPCGPTPGPTIEDLGARVGS